MLVGEQIQLPFGCHRKDMGRCGIRTNLEVTISPKQRLCLVRISFFGIECDNLGWSIIWRDLCGWASRKPTKFCTLLFLCFFSVLFRWIFLKSFFSISGDALPRWCNLGQLLFYRPFHERCLEPLHQSSRSTNVATRLGSLLGRFRLLQQRSSQNDDVHGSVPWILSTIHWTQRFCGRMIISIKLNVRKWSQIGHALDSRSIAKNYSYHNLPRGWMLVNDGYGCGYTSRHMLQDFWIWWDCWHVDARVLEVQIFGVLDVWYQRTSMMCVCQGLRKRSAVDIRCWILIHFHTILTLQIMTTPIPEISHAKNHSTEVGHAEGLGRCRNSPLI